MCMEDVIIVALTGFALPAGNEFSHTCKINMYSDFNALNHPIKIDYSHHKQIGTGPYRPLCYTNTFVNSNPCQTIYDNSLSCSDSTFKQTQSGNQWVISSGDIKSKYFAQVLNFNQAVLDTPMIIDGGSSSDRYYFIDQNNGYGSGEIKTDMITHSPYLSEGVIQACINRNPALTDSDLYEILVANSPLSIELAAALDGMTNILTSTQISNLQALQGGISSRDSIQNNVRWHAQQAELALNELLRLFTLDTNANNPTDSMIVYLESWNTLETKELLVSLYWQKEEYVKAQNAIDDIGNVDENEHLDFVLQKMHDVLKNGDSIPILLPDTMVLDSIAMDSTKAGQAWAQNLMYRLTGKLYPVYLHDTLGASSIMAEPGITPLMLKEELKNSNIQIFPNPNNGKFVIQFKDVVANAMVVYSLEGKKVYESKVSDQTQIEVQLPENLSGMFQLIIYGENEQVIHSEKLVINE